MKAILHCFKCRGTVDKHAAKITSRIRICKKCIALAREENRENDAVKREVDHAANVAEFIKSLEE